MKQPLLNNTELLKKYLDELKILNFQHKSSLFKIVGTLAIVIGIGLYTYFDSNLTVKLFGFDLGAVLAIFFGVVLIVALIYVAERRVGLNARSLENIVLNSDVTEKQVAEYIEQRIKETKENNQPKKVTYTEGSGFNDGSTVDKIETTGGMTQDIKNDLYKSIMNEAFELYNNDNNRQQKAILMLNFIVGHKFFRDCPMITYGDYESYLNEAIADISNPKSGTQSQKHTPAPASINSSESEMTYKDKFKQIKQIQSLEEKLHKLQTLNNELLVSNDGIDVDEKLQELQGEVDKEIHSITIENHVNKALNNLTDKQPGDKKNFLEQISSMLNDEKDQMIQQKFDDLSTKIAQAKADISNPKSVIKSQKYPPAPATDFKSDSQKGAMPIDATSSTAGKAKEGPKPTSPK